MMHGFSLFLLVEVARIYKDADGIAHWMVLFLANHTMTFLGKYSSSIITYISFLKFLIDACTLKWFNTSDIFTKKEKKTRR